MKITKHFFNEVLQDAIASFEDKIMKLPHPVEVQFQSKEEFMKSVKENPLIQQQIQFGLYQNIDKEYVGFAVVYTKDKHELKTLLGLPFYITICDEIAKEVLKPFKPYEIMIHLKHIFLHEITHIYDKWIKQERPDIWEACLANTHNNEQLANELLAEDVPRLILNPKEVALQNDVERRLWSKVYARMKKIAQNRNISPL